MIFVHGLRGGSIKTWQKRDDPRYFWPKHWLPLEPEFRHVSIHSFGYDSDWGSSQESFLDVHDFGRALYEEIRSSPMLRQNPNVRNFTSSRYTLTNGSGKTDSYYAHWTFHGGARYKKGGPSSSITAFKTTLPSVLVSLMLFHTQGISPRTRGFTRYAIFEALPVHVLSRDPSPWL